MILAPSVLDRMDFSQIEHLVLAECTEVLRLDFLQQTPHLKYLDLNYCPGIRVNILSLGHVPRLRVLKLRACIPFFVSHSHSRSSEL
jgi:hypothetical protein